MPSRTRSAVSPSPKRPNIILYTKSRPRFMRTLPVELREMIYEYLLVPRSIEVSFMSDEQAEAHFRAIQQANLSKNNTEISPSKYVILDDDPTDTDFRQEKKIDPPQTFKFFNKSPNKLVLHSINQETRRFALKHYTHIFKTKSNSSGLLFNFDLDYLSFTNQLNTSANARKYPFVERKSFQADIARIQNMAYLFFCHDKEMYRVHRGTLNARSFVTRFPALKKVIVALPVGHTDHLSCCNGGHTDEAIDPEDQDHFNNASSHFEELKQKMKDAGVPWVAPELIYMTYCFRSRWCLSLEEPEKPKKSS